MGKSDSRSWACSRPASPCFWAWGGRTDGEAETQAKTDPGQRAAGLHAGLHPRDRPCWLRAWDRLTTLSPGQSWRREGLGPISKGTATVGRDPLVPGPQEDLEAQRRVGWGVPWGLSCLCSRAQGSGGWAGGAVGPEPCGKGSGRGQSGMCPPGLLCWTHSDPRAACSAQGPPRVPPSWQGPLPLGALCPQLTSTAPSPNLCLRLKPLHRPAPCPP